VYIVVSPVNVKLGEESLSSEVMNQFSDERERIFVRDCPFI